MEVAAVSVDLTKLPTVTLENFDKQSKKANEHTSEGVAT
jgi:hypothetical protein